MVNKVQFEVIKCGSGCVQQVWLGSAQLGGQLRRPAAGHRVVLPSSGGSLLSGRRQEPPAERRGLFPAVLRGAAAEAAHDQGGKRSHTLTGAITWTRQQNGRCVLSG